MNSIVRHLADRAAEALARVEECLRWDALLDAEEAAAEAAEAAEAVTEAATADVERAKRCSAYAAKLIICYKNERDWLRELEQQ